ncbi:hypothetical protein N8306_04750, partial [Yoonia sp.]|nr:hypothetical protein [Yoonia sp.]
KPNDVRMEAHMDLPDDWSEYNPITSLRNIYQVTAAEVVIHHLITNNPNDQVRPEDFENEAAIGTLPTYEIIENYDGDLGRTVWASTDDYYAGDKTFYPSGTILRDSDLATLWAASDMAAIGANDGAEGFTNAWYTTMDREPFEPDLTDDGTAYETSGPRWRLLPNKYGQDLPGVEIPIDPSDVPPPTRDEIKYEVGAETQTVLNLLDWGAPAAPLSISAGWQDKPGEVSVNGMNYTDGFDMAVYIKGDVKPTEIYSSELVMDYELITPYAAGDTIADTVDDDYLVGIGSNTFNLGVGGSDLVVLTYGSSIEGEALTASIVNDFTVGDDAIGLIDLGVNDDNFESMITQTDNAGNLEIRLDGTLIATLVGVTSQLDASGELSMEEDFLLANPGPGDEPGGGDDDPNVIDGTTGADVLTGTAGDDIISGLAGNDTIYALAGDDELNGGSGLDRLYGGAGADVFVFETGTQLDIVYDFEDGVDQIELVGLNTADFGTAVDISERSSGTFITVGADRMLLRNVDDADISIDDFIFEDTILGDTLVV